MKNKLNTKNRIYIILIIVILTIVSSIFLINNKLSDKETQLDEVKLVNNNSSKSGMFAIMLQEENGEYKQSTKNDFPTEGYNYNADKSGCIDSKGLAVANVLTYTDKKFSVRTNQAVYCYVYFDKSNAKELIEQLKKSNGLSSEPVGGMYRYQGTNAQVNNYLCLEGKCSEKSDDMYRIIGITPEGNIKVIKQTSIGKYKWDTKYSVDSNYSSEDYYCTGEDCPTWEQSEIYKTLNDTFYNSLNDNIQNKIEPQKWWYGDIGYDYLGTLTTADEVYNIETGNASTQYYDKSGTLIESTKDIKWTKMSDKANIGLIYLHDYYYQSQQNNCHYEKGDSVYKKCMNDGWMHLSQNGNTSDNEWTMSRIGRHNGASTFFGAWYVNALGHVNSNGLHAPFAVRPVFYLKNNIKLYGSGTVDNPFTLTEPTNQENYLRDKDSNKTLSSTLVGGMYRYQGSSVDNYICLGKLNDEKCGYKSEDMYRIIGITPEGNIKVIKQTKYGSTYRWNTKYSETDSNEKYKCDQTNGCPEWPNSEMYTTLNETFYNSLSEEIKNKIQEWDWWYGDIEYQYVTNLTGENLYQIETGKQNSQYYGKLPSEKENGIITKKWDGKKTGNIGLIYLHDYYYQSKEDGCHYSKTDSSNKKCIDNGWIHLKQNGNASDSEWTMTRVGRYSSSSTVFYAWYLGQTGAVYRNSLDVTNAVRPVFYLKSDIELGGSGSTTDPFYIK